MSVDEDFRRQMQRLETLLRDSAALPDERARACCRDLVQSLLTLHGIAVDRMLTRMRAAGETGRAVLEECAREPSVAAVLLMHDLHPHDLRTRVETALERIVSQARQRGADLSLLALGDGKARVRLEGGDRELEQSIREAVASVAPEIDEVIVEVVRLPGAPGRRSLPVLSS